MVQVKNPKEHLEKFDTVDIVGFSIESENGEYVVIDNKLIDARGIGWIEIKNLTDNLESKFTNSNIHAVKITDKNGNVKWEREPKNHEVGNPVKWHEALLMAANGTPMHSVGSPLYMKLDNVTVVWADKKTNEIKEYVKVVINDMWHKEYMPYTPKEMVVDWTKVPVDTDVFIRQFKDGTQHKRKFKAFVGNKVFVESDKEDYLCSWPFTELAEPNGDYMKEAE